MVYSSMSTADGLPEKLRIGQGAIFNVIAFPKPWPPHLPMTMRYELEGGCLLVEVGIGRRIRATLKHLVEGSASVKTEVISCRIYPGFSKPSVLTVAWSKTNGIEIHLNGTPVGFSDRLKKVPARHRIPETTDDTPPRSDFSTRNEKAISKRAGRFGALKPKEGTLHGGTQYLMAALREEAAQLKGLLLLVDKGEKFHVRGISSRLRLLVVRTGQNPLLQTAAGAMNVPLIVYTCHNPKVVNPVVPAYSVAVADISAKPNLLTNNPVDLDVWLGLEAMQVGITTISHETLISDIGNTIGSHLDINILPSVIALRSGSYGISNTSLDFLSGYVVNVAKAILELCEGVLDGEVPC